MPPSAEEIDDSAVVWRRIPPWHFPKSPRQDRPDSPAFDDDSMSVDVAEDGWEPSDCLARHDGFGLVALVVGDLRRLDLTVVRDRLPGNPHHALVIGPKKKIRRDIAKLARWVVRPPAAYPPK